MIAGETHYHAYEKPLVYFQVLTLTGQFEPAIEFLSRIPRYFSITIHKIYVWLITMKWLSEKLYDTEFINNMYNKNILRIIIHGTNFVVILKNLCKICWIFYQILCCLRLYFCRYQVHGVHMALALHDVYMLGTPRNVQAPLREFYFIFFNRDGFNHQDFPW